MWTRAERGGRWSTASDLQQRETKMTGTVVVKGTSCLSRNLPGAIIPDPARIRRETGTRQSNLDSAPGCTTHPTPAARVSGDGAPAWATFAVAANSEGCR